MPSTQTIITLCVIATTAIWLTWRFYTALKRSACCGTCGCSLMSEKDKTRMLQRRTQKK
ncbi:hypothetical protein [Rubritalea marina]|uniref:hypothetical protein n=1 Tax=Rubritalea marina TaxID=361055 RepID=UPI00036ACD38|nr:hypothetical protein [Rubritalea marina]